MVLCKKCGHIKTSRPSDNTKYECKHCNNEKAKKWQAENKETYLARVKRSRAAIRSVVFKHYGNVCACCGETQNKFLSLDHVDNDGFLHATTDKNGKQVRRSRGGELSPRSRVELYYWLVANDFPQFPRIQVLCMNCNFGKSQNNGTCPHKENE